ncbi:MAG: arginine--tRNA ligase [Bdellovibrionota bacterium]
MERFAKIAAQAISAVLGREITPADLETPPDPSMGDFGFPCFKLSKEFRKSPPEIAKHVVSEVKSRKLVPDWLSVNAAGAYVNFVVAADECMRALLKDMLSGDGLNTSLGTYGMLPAGTRGTWVLEYSSPNIAKPLNIYHLRPTALGAALDRIGRYRGFNVVSINHLGDWGKQYGMLALAFRLFNRKIDDKLTMTELVDLYVKSNAAVDADPSLEAEARNAFLKLEQGDPEITALWKKCVEISIKEFNRIYQRLGVKFDHVWGESFYKDKLMPLIDDLKKRNLLELSEGAWVVRVKDEKENDLLPCIMQKSDGATIYATRDVAAAIYRHEKFNFDRMTYIVGAEQKLHFQQVFGVLRRMGLPWAGKCEHIPFGLYRFKDAKMSTRKGNFVTLEEVLALAKERVAELMLERAKDPDKPEAAHVAASDAICEAIAVGAVVFHDLHTDPVRDVEFEVDRVVDFEGETGPYLQYAHTRCKSILRKAHDVVGVPQCPAYDAALVMRLGAAEEIQLVRVLGRFPLHLERSLSFAKASQMAHYLIDLTKAFSCFYRECRVLSDDAELTLARLNLVEATRRVLARGLGLLGIPLPDRM